MKSSRIRIEAIADLDNLREAFLRAARGKAHREPVIAFRADLNRQLQSLRTDLLAGQVSVGHYQSFIIHEPKQRCIHAPCFRERVLHHAILNLCEPDFERWQIDDSFACRRGKGREAAVQRARDFAGKGAWFLKLDIAKYFDSIPHAQLIEQTRRHFSNPGLRALWQRIIEGYRVEAERGLPIGALTSQHLANFYLTMLDRFIKETLRVRHYIRYMDDMVLWGDKVELLKARQAIKSVVEQQLGLRLNRSQTLQPAVRGVRFLGYRIFPGGVKLSHAARRRFIARYATYCRWMETGRIEAVDAQRGVLALRAFVAVADKDSLLTSLFGGYDGIEKPLDDGHRARTGSTVAALGTTPRRTAGLPTATGTPLTTAGTTLASALPSSHAECDQRVAGLNRPSSSSARQMPCRRT